MPADLNRIAAVAVDSLLGDDERTADRRAKSRRLGGLGALALGIGLGVAARAAYKRVRGMDLARVAGSIEDKLGG